MSERVAASVELAGLELEAYQGEAMTRPPALRREVSRTRNRPADRGEVFAVLTLLLGLPLIMLALKIAQRWL